MVTKNTLMKWDIKAYMKSFCFHFLKKIMFLWQKKKIMPQNFRLDFLFYA